MMIYNVIQFLEQGCFPSPEKLLALKNNKVNHLLNVSGIDLLSLYSAEQLADFTLVQFTFKDVFSTGFAPQTESIEQMDCQVYCQQASEAEQMQFFNAVQQLIVWLKDNIRCYVFCQQGIGRSPSVLLAALNYHYRPEHKVLLKTIRFMSPRSKISVTSYAAAKWFAEQVNLLK